MKTSAWIVGILALTACGDDLPPGGAGSTSAATGGTSTGTTGEDLDQFPGLSAPVDVIIDDRGIPHIYGQTDRDVAYAAGYQMATDRLFQMELVRRRALGRQSEILPNKRSQDEVSLIFDLPRWGAANAQRLREEDPDTYRLIVAWLAGVNARITAVIDGEVPLPYGFGPNETNTMPERWTMADHSAIAKLMMLGNSNSLERELLATIVQRNFPEAWERIQLARPAFGVTTMPPAELPSAAPLRPGLAPPAREPIPATPEELRAGLEALHQAMGHIPTVGSNNWAIDGRLTASGRPLIAGDPHQPLQSPSLMYALHMNSADAGGQLDTIGWSFAGTFGVQLGHNRDLHWTATTNFADVMDIWEVEVVGDRVRVGDQMVTIEPREEVIGMVDGSAETLVIQDVPGYGVLLPEGFVPLPIAAAGHALLLNWTGMRATTDELTFAGMTTAATLDEFDAAADVMQVGGFNFMAASAEGITYRVDIDIPDRGDPSARPMPFVVVDGDDPGSLWDGTFLPPERLPRSRGEGRGWLATANNDPWGFTFDGDVSNDPWYYGYFFAAGHRAQRIDDELTQLAARGAITLEDMQALQSDTRSALAEALLPPLTEAWGNLASAPELEPFRDRPELETLYTLLTQTWDQRMERDRPGALAFHLFVMLLTEEVIADELSILYSTILGEEAPFVIKIPVLAVQGAYPNSEALLGASRDEVLLRTLSRVAGVLEDRFGGVDPAGYDWGMMHGTDFSNPFGGELEGGWWPTDGGEDTINVSSSAFLNDSGNALAPRFDSRDGAIFRVVTTFAEDGTPEAYCNFPPGNSADPQSPHFQDTLDGWIEDEYVYLPFRRAEIDAVAEQTITLMP